MTKEEAIETLWQYDVNFEPHPAEKVMHAIDMAIEALSAVCDDCIWHVCNYNKVDWDTISAKAEDRLYIKIYADDEPSRKAEKLYQICGETQNSEVTEWLKEYFPSAEAVQGWRTGKPRKSGKYIVTVDCMGHRMIDIFYYGQPALPNIKVKGMCWYRDDDEWGDVVYDDEDILAWMPLPEPYREDGEA